MSFAPVTAEAFDLAITPVLEAVMGASDYLTITPAQRRTRFGNALDAVPVIWEWVIGKGADLVNWILDNLGEFSGPTVPDKPISQWFEDWWGHIFTEPLYWATNPNPGNEL